MSKHLHQVGVILLMLAIGTGCGEGQTSDPQNAVALPMASARDEGSPEPEVDPADEPPPMADPVPLWEGGQTERQIDAATARENGYLVLELGDDWTPYLFSEMDSGSAERVPHSYRPIYQALARGDFPQSHHGDRARNDKYLELYGIMPTLGLLRQRFEETAGRDCVAELDYAPLESFEDVLVYQSNDRARRDARRYEISRRRVNTLMERAGVASASELDLASLENRDKSRVREYLRLGPAYDATLAAQARLRCEGYFEGKGDAIRGGLDWPTHEALAEFERRHRVYGWGFIGRDTLRFLRMNPLETEREAILRVLGERGMHIAGILEDGSRSTDGDGDPITYEGADGERHQVPNLEEQLLANIVEAFGLQTSESTLAWLTGLGSTEGSLRVAIPNVDYPEYYADDMDLYVEVDRGDVWYEFPYTEEGRERSQPTGRRPRLTLFTRYRSQKIPLARIGTTIGGWRSDNVDGTLMWRYKGSPTGPRVWPRIVSAPVWMPPESTPPRSLLVRNPRRGRDGEPLYLPNYHETGPSYASAYGLVAAYHREYRRTEDGEIVVRGDEGIRTHGSVDYMSIMRRHSHGCHRLHNHMAVRLMSFVLAHRAHIRNGHQPIAFGRDIEWDEQTYPMQIAQGGYVFELERPVPVNVREGRIRGRQATPIEHSIPKYDRDIGAYILPDGGAVAVDRYGNMSPIPYPTPEVADAGVPVVGEAQGTAPGAPALASPAPASPAPAPATGPTPGSGSVTGTPLTPSAATTPASPRPPR